MIVQVLLFRYRNNGTCLSIQQKLFLSVRKAALEIMPDLKNIVTLLKVIRTILYDSITIMLIFVLNKPDHLLKVLFSYLFIALFAFAFSYKTVRYLTQPKADGTAYADVECENEKENSIEKDEITDFYYDHFFELNPVLLPEEPFSPIELIVHFTAANYSKAIYSPPERLS
jgi:hypothetical protein